MIPIHVGSLSPAGGKGWTYVVDTVILQLRQWDTSRVLAPELKTIALGVM